MYELEMFQSVYIIANKQDFQKATIFDQENKMVAKV